MDLDGDGISTEAERTCWQSWIDLGGDPEEALGDAATHTEDVVDVSAYFLAQARTVTGPVGISNRPRRLPVDSHHAESTYSAARDYLRKGVTRRLSAKLSSPDEFPGFVSYCNAFLQENSVGDVRISPLVPEGSGRCNAGGLAARETLRSYAVIALGEGCSLLESRDGFAGFFEHIQAYPGCESASPSLARFAPLGGTTAEPNDPFFRDESEPDGRRKGSWGQTYPPYPGGPPYNDLWYLDIMQVPAAWDTEAGIMDIVIAVVDSGVDYTHPDIAIRIFINTGELPVEFEEEEGEYGDGDGLVTFEDFNTAAGRQFCEQNYGITDTNDNGIIDGGDLLTALEAGGLPRDARGEDGVLDDDDNGYADDLIGYDFAKDALGQEQDNDPMDEYVHGPDG